ncbi:2-C-methyl-D-erythritol 2,4-cyclodiphosphate synthase [Neorickettsia helminthoeca str. Oregon]|uniref:2-C-methyl-D-erythritol 2,4-cyclodiphosphate synthase n=1 Tax=Neorickettsia helminthoeca str. Oregon TaxID=1286528 RepID=X5HJ57_9RICK|nr:2-C-methyl-D-erythritol 2,4-cyclodiphosphate synthase [Neorickettsia helminthoeca]AHX11094.1 2-C-methyl-D-erythritol 2,4-cyclodiphosphate synthase [Neorickettsia helminthoeca str. Oregon]
MFRIGFGYDVHRIERVQSEDDGFTMLCSIQIPCSYRVIAHSDGDVALHALVDALLGAANIEYANDIGTLFPNTDPQWKGKASSYLVREVISLLSREGYQVNNADLTIVCEAPKIQSYKDVMRGKVAVLLGVAKSQVSIKATTTEKLGFEGRKEGISTYAVVSLIKSDPGS